MVSMGGYGGGGGGSEGLPEQVPSYNADGCDLDPEFFGKVGARRQDSPRMELTRIKNERARHGIDINSLSTPESPWGGIELFCFCT
jgi:hypothetical protein